MRLSVSLEQHAELSRLLSSGGLRPAHARRLRVILLTTEGLGGEEIAQRVGISRYQISRVRRRFRAGGVGALADRPRAGRGNRVAPDVADRILSTVNGPAPAGSARWTLALLANQFGLSRSVIYKILCAHHIGPYGRAAARRSMPAAAE